MDRESAASLISVPAMTNIFDNLFGKKKGRAFMRDVSALTKDLATSAIHVITQDIASRSYFGGFPKLPSDIAWPDRDGKKLAFLARISLAEVHLIHAVDWLPKSGALLFFYDMDRQPWGFDPKDRGGWAVLFVPDLENSISRSNSQSTEESHFLHRPIGFRRIDSFPSPERDAVTALDLTDDEFEKYGEIADQPYQEKPRHQISGFPTPVQGDGMELECQLVSNGLYCGDSAGYNDARVPALQSGATNWRLLFQIDSDDELDVMWGDCGTIYFWIDERAARSGDFSNAWLILQCC